MHSEQKSQPGVLVDRRIVVHRSVFVATFMVVLALTYGLLHAADLVPELTAQSQAPTAHDNAGIVASAGASSGEGAPVPTRPLDDTPRRVVIDAIGIDTTIVSPESRDIAVLDESLRRGVVHYPGSGNLEDVSNMFLFGHSSYLPDVRNKSFQAFNGLQKLEAGDLIRLEADDFEYRYAVTSVRLVDASEALVELSDREKKLTLSTCNSFGSPSDRFVVEAEYLGRVSPEG